ncbi:hypothetical protein J6590_055625 [Homalodisca vitripennis]|nr:hypothetical protein J6590_055625 [Homalodisca vitripennis]
MVSEPRPFRFSVTVRCRNQVFRAKFRLLAMHNKSFWSYVVGVFIFARKGQLFRILDPHLESLLYINSPAESEPLSTIIFIVGDPDSARKLARLSTIRNVIMATSLLLLCSVLSAGSVFGQNSVSLPQCITNEECSEETTCIDLVCEDPCLTLCTGNSTCKVHDHVPYCSCKPGYAGDPFTGCRESITAPPQCVTNSDCPEDRVCVGKRCKDPCLLGVCDKNSTCHVFYHIPYCSCHPGFYGDSFSKCTRQYPEGSSLPSPGAKKRYKLETAKANWIGALVRCMKQGGRLASISSKEENDQIKELIRRNGLQSSPAVRVNVDGFAFVASFHINSRAFCKGCDFSLKDCCQFS